MQCQFLYLIGQLREGGSERQLYYLLNSLNRTRYQPVVVVWNFSESEPYVSRIRDLGVPIFGFPPRQSSIRKLIRFRRLVRQLAPKVVHSYSFFVNFAAWWATLGSLSLAIGSVRSAFNWAKKSIGQTRAALNACLPTTQIFNSISALEEACSSQNRFLRQRLLMIPNAVDLKLFRSTSLALQREAIVVVAIGSLFIVKRWDRLIVAAKELKQRGFDFEINIAGEGPLRRELEALVRGSRLSDCVKLLGRVDDVSAVIARANFLVHTADDEGCPNVIMEALACGRPVIATDAGDVPYLIEEGVTGFVVSRRSPMDLVDRMERLIIDRDLCTRMGEAGRIRAEKGFGLDRLVSMTLATYRALGWRDMDPASRVPVVTSQPSQEYPR